MKAVKFVSALCIVILLSIFQNLKVSGQEKPSSSQNQTTQNPTQKKIDSDETKDFKNQTANTDRVNNRYRIGYEDTIDITVNKHAELSLRTSLNSDGTIFMPQIEQPIVAVCKTELELKQTIQNLYKTNILRNPFVNVQVVDQKSQPFAVIGAAEKPGSFYLNQRIQLLGLIALAGGPDVERSPSKVRIARVGNVSVCEQNPNSTDEDSKVEFITYKLSEVMDGTQNPWMQPGDVVSILEADEAYVVGNVFKPEKISLREPKSLTEAIAIAGGLDATAKTDKVIIQRQEAGKQNRTELAFDLKDIRDKKIKDPQLQANDIVVVSNDKIKSVGKGLLKALTNGLPNVLLRVPLP
ncbi:MAG: polysaccharide biosynthesis/export family protein [Acidobacteriota bacterium]